MPDQILCPSCQIPKGREEKCRTCGCPGETKRIEALEANHRESKPARRLSQAQADKFVEYITDKTALRECKARPGIAGESSECKGRSGIVGESVCDDCLVAPDDKPIGMIMSRDEAVRVFKEAFEKGVWSPLPDGIYAHEIPKIENACREVLEKLADDYQVPAVFEVKVSSDVKSGDLWVDFKISSELFGLLAELGLVQKNEG